MNQKIGLPSSALILLTGVGVGIACALSTYCVGVPTPKVGYYVVGAFVFMAAITAILKFVTSTIFPSPEEPKSLTPKMEETDRAIIRAFAEGDETKRAEAIAIHRRYINILGVRGTPEQDFMAEVDTPAPDLNLRNTYRNIITEDRHV